MIRNIEKESYIGNQKIKYFEKECEGDYTYMYGEWVWTKKEEEE